MSNFFLMIAAFAIVRLLQAPLQMAVYEEDFLSMTPKTRLSIVTLLSIGGTLIIGILALRLLEMASSIVP